MLTEVNRQNVLKSLINANNADIQGGRIRSSYEDAQNSHALKISTSFGVRSVCPVIGWSIFEVVFVSEIVK